MIKSKIRRAEVAKAWYHENKDKIRLRRKELRPIRHFIDPRKQMFHSAKKRAKEKKINFNIRIDDINVPPVCPLLGIELKVSRGNVGPNSPTLDRIIPELGYVKDNILVVSNKANSIKQDASVQDLEILVENLKKYTPVV